MNIIQPLGHNAEVNVFIRLSWSGMRFLYTSSNLRLVAIGSLEIFSLSKHLIITMENILLRARDSAAIQMV